MRQGIFKNTIEENVICALIYIYIIMLFFQEIKQSKEVRKWIMMKSKVALK
jgi:hypothetical protein